LVRCLVGLLVVCALGVLVAAAVTDTGAHARERRERADLVSARHRLSKDQFYLAVTNYETALADQHRAALQSSIASTLGQLGATNGALGNTNVYAFLQGTNITTLQSCLGGVQNAYQQIAGNNNGQAAKDISAVSGPCLLLAGGTSDGLAYPFDFPDPDVLLVGGTYFAYATNAVAGNIQIIESTDLVHWSPAGNALPQLPSWATPDATWAPGVALIGGNVLLYYAAEVAGPGGGEECISVATATQPQGPFVDTSTAPLECQPSSGGSIDPAPFIDTNGNIYLLWKSNDAKIWSQQLDPAGTGFLAGSSPTQLLVPDQSWQGGNVEAPDMVTTGGRYFLFFSGNDWSSANYAVGVASCAGPLGPCTDSSSQPLLTSGAGVDGPGGESVFADATGSFWIAFDGYVPGAVGYPNSRDLFLRRLDLSGHAPIVEKSG
jgi:Glycosyl hydrolases family 43